eukprot:scpid23263/ scgid0835/ 
MECHNQTNNTDDCIMYQGMITAGTPPCRVSSLVSQTFTIMLMIIMTLHASPNTEKSQTTRLLQAPLHSLGNVDTNQCMLYSHIYTGNACHTVLMMSPQFHFNTLPRYYLQHL